MNEQPNINFGDITLTITEQRTSTRQGQNMTKKVELTFPNHCHGWSKNTTQT
jgi:hypothetical protein